MEEVKEYDLGNIKLKIKGTAPIKVYKCPYLGCDKFFLSKEDREKHLVIDHGEILKSQNGENKIMSEPFDLKKSIEDINFMIKRQRLKYLAFAIKQILEKKRNKHGESARAK